MPTTSDDIAAALAEKSATSPSSPSSPKQAVNVRPASDYSLATEPSFPVDYADATASERSAKLRKNPLVPLGALATAGVLAGGLVAFRRGNAAWSQRMMQARIGAQATTLAILAGSVYVAKAEEKR